MGVVMPYITKRGKFFVRGIPIQGIALFSPCESYRYRVRYIWDESKPAVGFCLLNPSTATHEQFDRTLRRCFGYAMDWGYGSFEIVNIFAWRSPNPADLKQVDDPIGGLADSMLTACQAEVDKLVLGWGDHGRLGNRCQAVTELLRPGGKLHYLKMTKSGQPAHPLYLKRDLKPIPLHASPD